MFLVDLAFAVELIALGLGVCLLVWACRSEGAGVALAKVFGYIITIAAILTALCTLLHSVSYWRGGYYHSPVARMMMKRQMMQQGCPMMQRMQQNQQGSMMQQNQKTDSSTAH